MNANLAVNTVEGDPGRSNILETGSVKLNAFKDRQELLIRKSNLGSTETKTFYPGPLDNMEASILAKELVYSMVKGGTIKSDKGGLIPVLSTLSGAFDSTDKLHTLYPRIVVMGVAESECINDFKNHTDGTTLAVLRGGTATVIWKSDVEGKLGQRAYWEFPNPKDPYDCVYNGVKRITLHMKPYDPTIDAMTKNMILEVMKREKTILKSTEYEDQKDQPLYEGSLDMLNAWRNGAVIMADFLIRTGMVSINPNYANREDRRLKFTNGLKERDINPNSERVKFLCDLAKGLHCSSVPAKDVPVPIDSIGGERNLHELLTEWMLASADYAKISSLKNGVVQKNDCGTLLSNQIGYFDMITSSVLKTDSFRRERIIFTLLNNVKPWGEVDINFGNYMM